MSSKTLVVNFKGQRERSEDSPMVSAFKGSGRRRKLSRVSSGISKMEPIWCTKHMVYVEPKNFEKHVGCNERKFKMWANRYRKARKEILVRSGTRKRTSTVTHYCKEHGKFVGFTWCGHKRLCKAQEITEPQFLKLQADQEKPLEASVAAKIPEAEVGPRERAFENVMKIMGIAEYSFKGSDVEYRSGEILIKKTCDPHRFSAGDIICSCCISDMGVDVQRKMVGSSFHLLLEMVERFSSSPKTSDRLIITVRRRKSSFNKDVDVSNLFKENGKLVASLDHSSFKGSPKNVFDGGFPAGVDKYFLDLRQKLSELYGLISETCEGIVEVGTLISSDKKEIGNSKITIGAQQELISSSAKKIAAERMNIARLEKLILGRSKMLKEGEKEFEKLSREKERILSSIKRLSSGISNGKHVHRS